jgi:hypothetical protein
MPATRRAKPLYRRGKYALHRRADRANLEIVWYDGRRERSSSAGTADVGQGKLALDRLYLHDGGELFCPTCHRPWDSAHSPLLSAVIADYLILAEGTAGFQSAKHRLAHVVDYLKDRPETRVTQVDVHWVERFRAWLLAKPVTKGRTTRQRTIGSVEGSVLQLAAAINRAPGQTAMFKATQMQEVAKSPAYRASVKTLAAMFRFAMEKEERVNLLRYLRFAVATWARPDAIYDAGPAQWHEEARVLDLNPPNRKQTKKHRPKVPIARQFVPFLSDGDAFIPVKSVRSSWDKMAIELGLPRDRESGPKLIRRSVATLARKQIGEANWQQGRMMLGHVKASVSDIYALPDPANLGLALAATEALIDAINKLAPGAFYRAVTATGNRIMVVKGGKSA